MNRIHVINDRCRLYYNNAVAFVGRSLLEKRAALYALPLLLHWAIGITIEREERPRRSALRSMILFYLYLISTLVLIIAYDRAAAGRDPNYYGSIALYYTQLLTTLSYVGFSIRLALLEWRDTPAPEFFVDRFAAELVSIFER